MPDGRQSGRREAISQCYITVLWVPGKEKWAAPCHEGAAVQIIALLNAADEFLPCGRVTGQVHSKDPSPVARAIVAGLAMAERS